MTVCLRWLHDGVKDITEQGFGEVEVEDFIMRSFTRYYYRDQIKERDIGETCSSHGRYPFRIFVTKPDGKRPFDRLRHGLEDDIRMVLKRNCM